MNCHQNRVKRIIGGRGACVGYTGTIIMCLLGSAFAPSVSFIEQGGIHEYCNSSTEWHNRAVLMSSLNGLAKGDHFYVENYTFCVMGGILVEKSLVNVTIYLDGTLTFSVEKDEWPRQRSQRLRQLDGEHGDEERKNEHDGEDEAHEDERDKNRAPVMQALDFYYLENVFLSSSGGADARGTLNGQGYAWWRHEDIRKITSDRPRLLTIRSSRNVVMEKWRLLNSPFWSFLATDVDGFTVRSCEALTSWSYSHQTPPSKSLFKRLLLWLWKCLLWYSKWFYALDSLRELTAYNTDGFDFQGDNVHGHDLRVQTADDAIAVKGTSSNHLYERVNVNSGLGLAIGGIGSDTVRNVTFRNCVLAHTIKAIYIKVLWRDSGPDESGKVGIFDVLYENITITRPQQFAVWVGPAQQTGQHCSLKWPYRGATCQMSAYQQLDGITLRNITIYDPLFSPGVVLGNESNPITRLTFSRVQVRSRSTWFFLPNLSPWGFHYHCLNAQGQAIYSSPTPTCLVDYGLYLQASATLLGCIAVVALLIGAIP